MLDVASGYNDNPFSERLFLQMHITLRGSKMRTCFAAILTLGVCIGCGQGGSATSAGAGKNNPKQLPDIVGVTHVDGKYHLTEKDFLNEGADQILALGSRVIKVWFHNPPKSYSFNSQWPPMPSMVETARSPYFRKLFDKPFTTYIMMCFSKGRGAGYFRNDITAEQELDEQRQFYELAKHLLTTYRQTGKTFILQHWEGDWLIRASYNGNVDPTPLNARQAGVNQAREEVTPDGVHVYHAAEVNRVVASMKDGKPNLVNTVLPHTKLDLVSYSAWDATTWII
jgi:hypothetical protein